MSTKHSNCTCDYISPGAAALHAIFHGVDGPLPKVPNMECSVHEVGPRAPEVFIMDDWSRDNHE